MKQILLSTHMMIAGLASAPAFMIDDGEAETLASAMGRVARWYDIPEIGEKAMDHYALAAAVGTVYGTRLFAWIASGKPAATTNARPPQPRPEPAPKPDEQPRGDGSASYDDPVLGKIDVPPLAGAHPHTGRPN